MNLQQLSWSIGFSVQSTTSGSLPWCACDRSVGNPTHQGTPLPPTLQERFPLQSPTTAQRTTWLLASISGSQLILQIYLRFSSSSFTRKCQNGCPAQQTPNGISKFGISIILSCRNAVEDAVNCVLNNLLMYPLHRLETS